MQPILSRLEALARKAPPRAQVLLRRLRDVYRIYRPPATTPAVSPAVSVTPPSEAPLAPPPIERASEPNWELRSQDELVDHIEQHYHAGLRRDLPRLVQAARQIEREHASDPRVPAGLADVLATLSDELESHMLKEETMLFPVIRTGTRGGSRDMPIDMPIRMMEREHDSHGAALEQIRELTGDLRPPPEASAAWVALYDGLEALETDLRQHIYLENNVLFLRALGGR